MRKRKESLSVQNSIQTRLSFVMALVMVFVVCINFFIFEQIHTGVDRIDAVFSSNAAINDLSDTLNKLEGTVYEYLNIKGTKALENYYRYEQDYRELLDKLEVWWRFCSVRVYCQIRSRSCLVTLHLLTCFRLGNVMKPMYFL